MTEGHGIGDRGPVLLPVLGEAIAEIDIGEG